MPGKLTYEELEQRLSRLEQAQEMLNHENGDWEATFNALNTPVWVIGKDYRILRSNKMCGQMFHLTEKEMIGRHCWEIVHGTHEPIPECPLLLARESLKRETMIIRLNYKWYQVTVDPILDEDGRFAKAVHIISDITERTLAYDRLQRGESLLKRTEKLANIGGWEWDVGSKTMYWTEGLYHIHGLDPSLFIPGSSRHIDESLKCYRPKDRAIVIEAFGQCVETGREYDFEFPFTKLTGEKIWIRTAAKPLRESGRVIKVVGHIMDITDRKKAQETIVREKAKLEKALSEIKTLSGFLPICSSCKKIRDDKGYWNQIEAYIRDHSEAEFSHSICPECARKLYPDLDISDD